MKKVIALPEVFLVKICLSYYPLKCLAIMLMGDKQVHVWNNRILSDKSI